MPLDWPNYTPEGLADWLSEEVKAGTMKNLMKTTISGRDAYTAETFGIGGSLAVFVPLADKSILRLDDNQVHPDAAAVVASLKVL
jgi:hypothetical protein